MVKKRVASAASSTASGSVSGSSASDEPSGNRRDVVVQANPGFKFDCAVTKFPISGASNVVAYLEQTKPQSSYPAPPEFTRAIEEALKNHEEPLRILRRRNKAMYDSGDTGGCELDPSGLDKIAKIELPDTKEDGRPVYHISRDYPFLHTARVSTPPTSDQVPVKLVLDRYVFWCLFELHWRFLFPYIFPFLIALCPVWISLLVSFHFFVNRDSGMGEIYDENLRKLVEKARPKLKPGVWTSSGKLDWHHPQLYSIPWFLKPHKWLRAAVGDCATLTSFTVNSVPDESVMQERLWVTVTENLHGTQPEAIAIDFAFPIEEKMDVNTGKLVTKAAKLNSDTRFILLVAGLNGGTREPYMLSFARSAVRKNYVVASICGRGFGGNPISGLELWCSSRIADAKAASYACEEIWKRMMTVGGWTRGHQNRIFAIGFSMGGLTIGKLFADAQFCQGNPFRAGCSIGGTLDSSMNASSHRTHWLWQPGCFNFMKLAFSHYRDKVKARNEQLARDHELHSGSGKMTKNKQFKPLDPIGYEKRGANVLDFDLHFNASYSGCGPVGEMSTVLDYYRMHYCNMENIQTPLLLLTAMDDCMVPVEGVAPALASDAQHKCIIMITEHGGHMSWPKGSFGSKHYDRDLEARMLQTKAKSFKSFGFLNKFLEYVCYQKHVLSLSISESSKPWLYTDEVVLSGSTDGSQGFFDYCVSSSDS